MSDSTSLPKRVIDVGPADGSQEPFLVETYGTAPPPAGPYVALSYCWGSKTNFTTTSSTLTERKAGFMWRCLPKTIQDAIAITRHLNIRYIWIDALCIIQDDRADWEAEAANMASIYEGALLTISATVAADVEDGFLVSRRNFVGQHKIPSPKADQESVFIRRRLPHSSIVSEQGSTEGCPLLLRGWTLQERLLARRTLHFLPHELVWECKCQFWCECGSVRADLSWKSGLLRGSLYNKTITDPKLPDLAGHWRVLVQDYSKRKLTRPQDRLPALSGIAHKFQSLGLHDYLAGLWRTDIFRNLMWKAVHPSEESEHREHTTSPKSIKDSAPKPSWSWVSSSLPVTWTGVTAFGSREYEYSSTATASADCILASQDAMGQVSSGTILMDAVVTTTTVWRREGKQYRLGKSYDDKTQAIFTPDFDPSESTLDVGSLVCCLYMVSKKDDKDTEIWFAIALVPIEKRSLISSRGDRVTASEYYSRIGVVEGHSEPLRTPWGEDIEIPRWFHGTTRRRICII